MKRLFFSLSIVIIAISAISQENARGVVIEKIPMTELKMETIDDSGTKPDKAVAEHADFTNVSIRSTRSTFKGLYDRPEGVLIPSTIGDRASLGFTYSANMFLGSAFSIPWALRNISTGADAYEWINTANGAVITTEEQLTLVFSNDEPFLKPYYRFAYPRLDAKQGSATSTYTPKEVTTGCGMRVSQGEGLWLGRADLRCNTTFPGSGTPPVSLWIYQALETERPEVPGEYGWYFGTCYHPGRNQYQTMLVSFYEKPQSPMLIKEVSFRCATDLETPIAGSNRLDLVAYKLNEEGKLDFNDDDEITNEVLASGYIRGFEALQVEGSEENVYLNFKFIEVDDIGIEIESYFLVQDAFAFVLYGVDQPDQDFGVVSDRANQIDRSSFIVWRNADTGKLRRDDDGNVLLTTANICPDGVDCNDPDNPYEGPYWSLNFYLTMLAHFSFLYVEPGMDDFTIPVSGGTKSVDIYSDFPWTSGSGTNTETHVWNNADELPDWIAMNTGVVFLEEDFVDYLTLDIEIPALPSGVTGRGADIHVWNYRRGNEVVLSVRQGEIFNVSFVIVDENNNPIKDVVIQFDNETLSGTSKYVVPGTYQYKIFKPGFIDEEGEVTVEDKDVVLTVEMQVGIRATGLDNIALYPNPFTNQINITNSRLIKNVQIMNIAGQRVNNVNFNNGILSTENLSSGIYFVVIEGINGQKVVHKMVKK